MTKKTIGILTHYQVHNHGAILQMYALYRTLQILNAVPCVLTYSKNFDFIAPELKNKYTLSFKSIPFYLQYLCRQGFVKTLFNLGKNRRLNQFKKKHFCFAPYDTTPLDSVVVGSDEVFSLEAGVNRMMYGYGVQSKHVFSYAASFGQTNMEDIERKHCQRLITEGLKRFSRICVRDQASADTVKKLTGKNPAVHFDPVLLYGFKGELTDTVYKTPSKPYLLVYAYDTHMNSTEEIQAIKKFAQRKGLLIVSPGFYHSWVDKNLNVNPLELLQMFKHASYVVTDTFHGSVLSLLTNRSFAAFVRKMNTNKMSFLLSSLGAEAARLFSWQELDNTLARGIVWSIISQNIAVQRARALAYLKEALYG